MKYHVFIRSFERPSTLLNLLLDLEREGAGRDVSVSVFDDASKVTMAAVRRFCERRGWRFQKSKAHHGKPLAWRLWNDMLESCHGVEGDDLAVFFDDDMRLCSRFFDRLAAAWASILDPQKASLVLLVDSGRIAAPCWTGFAPERASQLAEKIQWVDGSFAMGAAALSRVRYQLEPIAPRRWARDERVSTGVGQQLSTRLVAAGMNLYRSYHSLVAHTEGPSHMNPEVRSSQPLSTQRFIDGAAALDRLSRREWIEASLAAIPSREEGLAKVVEALLPQVNLLRVYLNGFTRVPRFLRHAKIVVGGGPGQKDLGDSGKFFWAEQAQGIQLICDDDLNYPRGYARKMLTALNTYDGEAVVGLHGVTLVPPITSYYRSRRVIHFSRSLRVDTAVHMLGTGVLAYRAGVVDVKFSDFLVPNMADVWFGRLCQRQGVPMVTIARETNFVTAQENETSIHRQMFNRDTAQTDAVNEGWPWRIHNVHRPLPTMPALSFPGRKRPRAHQTFRGKAGAAHEARTKVREQKQAVALHRATEQAKRRALLDRQAVKRAEQRALVRKRDEQQIEALTDRRGRARRASRVQAKKIAEQQALAREAAEQQSRRLARARIKARASARARSRSSGGAPVPTEVRATPALPPPAPGPTTRSRPRPRRGKSTLAGRAWAGQLGEMAASVLADHLEPADRQLLHFGCGHGGLSLLVRDRLDREVVGVDVSASAVAMATAAGADAQLAKGFDRLPFEDGEFDAVLTCCSLQKVPDDYFPLCVLEIKRVLRSGALVVLVEGMSDDESCASPSGDAIYRTESSYTAWFSGLVPAASIQLDGQRIQALVGRLA